MSFVEFVKLVLAFAVAPLPTYLVWVTFTLTGPWHGHVTDSPWSAAVFLTFWTFPLFWFWIPAVLVLYGYRTGLPET